ncbi:hypothetical protein [Lapidilactobacillus bayanensis]|uniref:hypothetical protein n=1 Tax=Lapidilactobacillus bayanensis TaxID=2485998 RepID=UPI000F7B2565|nr:hypothetical protein [Lapidilactobacillus bayanensis]
MSLKQKFVKRIIVIIIGCLLVGVAAWFFNRRAATALTPAQQTQLAVFSQVHSKDKVTSATDHKKEIDINGDLTVPKHVINDEYPLLFKMWYEYNATTAQLTLQSRDSNDLLVYEFVFDFKQQRVYFYYDYQVDVDDERGVDFKRTYRLTDSGTKLVAIKSEQQINYRSAKQKAAAKADIQQVTREYERALNWLLKNQASYPVLKTYATTLAHDTDQEIAAKQSKASKQKKQAKKASRQAQAKEADDQAAADVRSYHAHFTDTQWRKYILLRAQSLKLTNPTITVKTLSAAEEAQYFSAWHNGTGGVPRSTKLPYGAYYWLHAAGKDYVVTLPTIFYNESYLKDLNNDAWYPQKITADMFADYFSNADYPDDSLDLQPTNFVPKTRQPTVDEIVLNIMICAPTKDSD